MKKWIGIDPGTKGALAVIKENGKIKIYDTPNKEVKINKRHTKDYDIPKCVELIKKIGPANYFVEGVKAFFFSSKLANFDMGRGRGLWEGILSGLGFQYELVSPVVWKKEYYKKKSGKDDAQKKRRDVKAAKRRFPKAAKYFTLKKHHDRADALLIAGWGRKHGKEI